MQQSKLLIFNPEHDLAIANGDPHFMAPTSAITFAQDCAWIPAWIYRHGTILCTKIVSKSFLEFCQQLGLNVSPISALDITKTSFSEILPWGWNPMIRQKLQTLKISETLLPTLSQLDDIRHLSHRKRASEAMILLRKYIEKKDKLPQPAQELTSLEDAVQFLVQYPDAVFKAPLSGSGRGIRWGKESLDTHLRGWIQNTIQKQGSLFAEKRMKVIQNFAAEFYCHNKINFIGYSLFNTKNAVYEGNFLLSDTEIEKHLAQWISLAELNQYLFYLQTILTSMFVGKYYGYIGVDMFIYQENNTYKINPMVEINARTTMGCLARIFYDEFVDKNSAGFLEVKYYPLKNIPNTSFDPQKILIQNKKIIEGTISLSPLGEYSTYQIIATIHRKNKQ